MEGTGQSVGVQTFTSPLVKTSSGSSAFHQEQKGRSLLASVCVCHARIQENHIGNKSVKQSRVGCDRCDDKLPFSYGTRFYLALEIAVLRRGAV